MERAAIKQSQPASVLVALAESMQSMTNASIARNLGYSPAKALAICRIARKLSTDQKMSPQAPVATVHSSVFIHPDISTRVDISCESALLRVTSDYSIWGRRPGELGSSELSRRKGTEFGGTYSYLKKLSPEELAEMLIVTTHVREFLSVCDYTFRKRAERRKLHLIQKRLYDLERDWRDRQAA